MASADPIPALKVHVATAIAARIEGLSLGYAGANIGADRWRAADIRAGRLERFSLDALIRIAARIGIHVEILLN